MSNKILESLMPQIESIVEKCGLELYYVDMPKKNGTDYLSIYIDKKDGVTLDDCEKVSKNISDMLDEEDPIPFSYCLEVSSPGIERVLYNDKHLEKYTQCDINIKLKKSFNGIKKLTAALKGFNEDSIIVQYKDEETAILRNNIKEITLKVDF